MLHEGLLIFPHIILLKYFYLALYYRLFHLLFQLIPLNCALLIGTAYKDILIAIDKVRLWRIDPTKHMWYYCLFKTPQKLTFYRRKMKSPVINISFLLSFLPSILSFFSLLPHINICFLLSFLPSILSFFSLLPHINICFLPSFLPSILSFFSLLPHINICFLPSFLPSILSFFPSLYPILLFIVATYQYLFSSLCILFIFFTIRDPLCKRGSLTLRRP